MKKIIAVLLALVCALGVVSYAFADETEPSLPANVYDENGFLVSPIEFMALYDNALEGIQYFDWEFSLNQDQEGTFLYDSITEGKRIEIGNWFIFAGASEPSVKHLGHDAYLSFEGNDNYLDPMTQVAVTYEANHFLTNYTDSRSRVILNLFAALPVAIDPSINTLEEGMAVVDAVFSIASGGLDIHNSATTSLPNVPATYQYNGVIYTVSVANGVVFLYATIGNSPLM